MTDFKDMVKVGVRGSGWEKGLKASEVFTNRFQNKWLRDDAYYAIVYVSDEADQSEKEVAEHLKQISKWKENDNLIKAYSIVDLSYQNQNPSSYKGRRGIQRGHERYLEMSERTGGSSSSIKGDFHETLLDMGSQIATLTTQFSLSAVPYDTTDIRVLVDGVEVTEWNYVSASNSIQFNVDAAPTDNAQIEVIYSVEDK